MNFGVRRPMTRARKKWRVNGTSVLRAVCVEGGRERREVVTFELSRGRGRCMRLYKPIEFPCIDGDYRVFGIKNELVCAFGSLVRNIFFFVMPKLESRGVVQ
jgi:hypothetical protein